MSEESQRVVYTAATVGYGETNYLPIYIQQQNTKLPKIQRFQSLAFYSGPNELQQFQQMAYLIIKELINYYKNLQQQSQQQPKTPLVVLSPWTCYISKNNDQLQEIKFIEQEFLIDQVYPNTYIREKRQGLVRYLAPELIIDMFEPTVKSDIFSLGCLLLMLFDNSTYKIGWLFEGIHTEQEYILFVKNKLPTLEPISIQKKFDSPECWNYLKKMASFKPEDRPSLEEIITSNRIFPSDKFNIELGEIPEFKFKYYQKPWNGNQFDGHFSVGQPLLDSNQKTQYFLGQQKYSQSDVTIFKDSIAYIRYEQFKSFLPDYNIYENNQNDSIIISRTCANYIDERDYQNYKLLQEKETFEIDTRFEKFELQTQRQANLLVFQFIFVRCILEESKLFLSPNTKYSFVDSQLLIAGPQFITSEVQEEDFILKQLSKIKIENQIIKYVIDSLINNTMVNYLALIKVGQELDEIVVNRDYFNNVIKRNGLSEKIKQELGAILNFYDPKFMRRELNILLRNFIRDHRNEFDTRYLEQLQSECNN